MNLDANASVNLNLNVNAGGANANANGLDNNNGNALNVDNGARQAMNATFHDMLASTVEQFKAQAFRDFQQSEHDTAKKFMAELERTK